MSPLPGDDPGDDPGPDQVVIRPSSRAPIPTWYFVLVVVRLGHRFLLVHERTHDQPWYLPAGRIEPGEEVVHAAERETLEETGVPIVVEGLLRIEHTPLGETARVRFVVVARPVDDTQPKQQADDESLGAAWVTLEELERLPLRGAEVRDLFRSVAAGAPVYPLNVLTTEGAAYQT